MEENKEKFIRICILVILIGLIVGVNIYLFSKYYLEPRQENHVNFNDKIYFDCAETEEGAECIMPDGQVLKFEKVWNITLGEK